MSKQNISVRPGKLSKAVPAIQAAGAQVDSVKTDHRGRHTVTITGGNQEQVKRAPGVRNLD